MSKQMTPCERLGYKVGDEFEVIRHHAFKKGQVVTLHEDDGTECPLFAGDGGGAGVFDGVECSFATLNKQVRKIANKLKPAKQTLADAIHQNGGWHGNDTWLFSTQSGDGVLKFWKSKPKAQKGCVCTEWSGGCRLNFALSRVIQNWHQTILSRDEYFIAYPEQVKVEVDDETERKVGVGMKSESEATINASDWHKNGELPPVGEVCIFDPTGGECYFNDDELKAKGHQVCILAHTKYKQEYVSVAVFKWDLDECCGVSSANACSFRPIRTEREKAIDEMVCEFIDHHGDPKGGERYLGIAEKLYDAGYRKEVK